MKIFVWLHSESTSRQCFIAILLACRDRSYRSCFHTAPARTFLSRLLRTITERKKDKDFFPSDHQPSLSFLEVRLEPVLHHGLETLRSSSP